MSLENPIDDKPKREFSVLAGIVQTLENNNETSIGRLFLSTLSFRALQRISKVGSGGEAQAHYLQPPCRDNR